MKIFFLHSKVEIICSSAELTLVPTNWFQLEGNCKKKVDSHPRVACKVYSALGLVIIT